MSDSSVLLASLGVLLLASTLHVTIALALLTAGLRGRTESALARWLGIGSLAGAALAVAVGLLADAPPEVHVWSCTPFLGWGALGLLSSRLLAPPGRARDEVARVAIALPGLALGTWSYGALVFVLNGWDPQLPAVGGPVRLTASAYGALALALLAWRLAVAVPREEPPARDLLPPPDEPDARAPRRPDGPLKA